MNFKKVRKRLFLGHFNDDLTLDMRFNVNKGRVKESPEWSDYLPSKALVALLLVVGLLLCRRRRARALEHAPQRPRRWSALSDEIGHLEKIQNRPRRARTAPKRL